jgi:hypothetical protein
VPSVAKHIQSIDEANVRKKEFEEAQKLKAAELETAPAVASEANLIVHSGSPDTTA